MARCPACRGLVIRHGIPMPWERKPTPPRAGDRAGSRLGSLPWRQRSRLNVRVRPGDTQRHDIFREGKCGGDSAAARSGEGGAQRGRAPRAPAQPAANLGKGSSGLFPSWGQVPPPPPGRLPRGGLRAAGAYKGGGFLNEAGTRRRMGSCPAALPGSPAALSPPPSANMKLIVGIGG